MEKTTSDVVKSIAQIQINAISRIIDNPEDNDSDLLRDLFGISNRMPFGNKFISRVKSEALERVNLYKEILENPEIIKTLDEYQLLVCSHILFRMECEWIIDNSEGVVGTWELLNHLIGRKHPELKLIIC